MIFKYMATSLCDNSCVKVNLLKYIFEENTLRFSSPLFFNDPFEMRPYIDILEIDEDSIAMRAGENLINSSGKAHLVHEKILDDVLKNVGTLCLSTTNDNLNMWGHYADSHKGIVIEFDNEHSFFSYNINLEVIHYLKKVNYLDKKISINSNNWADDERVYLSKNIYWDDEDEYRMTIYVEEAENSSEKYNIKFPPEIIKAIYIGCKTSDEDMQYIKNLINLDIWKHLKIIQFVMDEKEYKLVPIDCKLRVDS